MQTILVSWLAWKYDFGDGAVDPEGPTNSLHKRFFDSARHVFHLLLSPAEEGDTRTEMLYTHLRRHYPDHRIALVYVPLDDILNFSEIKSKAERLLAAYREYEMDILFSNGTTPMRTAWVLIHLENNGLNTHLIQGLDADMGGGTPGFREVGLDASIFNQRLVVKQQIYEQGEGRDFYQAEVLKPVYERAAMIAQEDKVFCLIQGESGVGKEKLAYNIHALSPRSQGPFKAINCAAFRDELLESRLFGHKKGAFTGAQSDHRGLFEAAEGGTLFLDEIGDISPYMQQSLLRVLQEKEILPVGANEPRKIDVRVIAATHRDLWQACEKGTFRWDLYYRLAITELELPALREYPVAELKQLIDWIVNKRAPEFKGAPLRLSHEVMEILLTHDYPGNIRELDHIILNGYVFAKDEMTLDHLPRHFLRHKDLPMLSLEAMEARHIRKVLGLYDYNLSQTCQALGLAVNTLKSKMGKYGIPRKREQSGQ